MVISVRTISPKRMVLDFRPVSAWAYRIFGLVFMVCGAAVAVLLSGSVSFRCARWEGTCRYEQSTPFGQTSRLVTIADLRGGTTEVRHNGPIASLTLVAITRTGDLDVPLLSADGVAKDSLARALTAFRKDPSIPEFAVFEDRRTLGYLYGGLLLAAGLVCLLAIERVRLILDRDTGLLQLRHRRWMRTKGVRARLDRVKGVTSREQRFRNTASWSVTIQLEDGSDLPLTRLPLFTATSSEQARQLVTRWLA